MADVVTVWLLAFASAALAQPAKAPPPPMIPVPAAPAPALPRGEALPAGYEAVAEFMTALVAGDGERAAGFLAEDVSIQVSNLERTLHTITGRLPARAMHASMTNRGSLGVEGFSCRPEAQRVRCDVLFANARTRRHFTLRFEAAGGPITRLLSWENH
jgi:hypothetical protein